MKNWSTESLKAAEDLEKQIEAQSRAEAWSVGDVVYLKSGSRPMTVARVHYSTSTYNTPTLLKCYWYDYPTNTIHKEELPVLVLTKKTEKLPVVIAT